MDIFLYTTEFSEGGLIVIFILIAMLIGVMLNFILKMAEISYVIKYRKPFFVHFPAFLKKLSRSQTAILQQQFRFYNKLSARHQKYFAHRVASFIKDKKFIGRDGLEISEEIKVLISATAVMLTFGFRNFYIGIIDSIFVYPDEFYSANNEMYHKGEFNPRLKALVFSWKDFKEGFESDTDKINLGIHEFAHAIHLNSIRERDVSSTLFSDSFKELTDLLGKKEKLRLQLVDSKYFREYAYTNQYEFVAVIIETFIESPDEFRTQFPEVYDKTRQMLNFRFAGY